MNYEKKTNGLYQNLNINYKRQRFYSLVCGHRCFSFC